MSEHKPELTTTGYIPRLLLPNVVGFNTFFHLPRMHKMKGVPYIDLLDEQLESLN